jgi:hypothetical protein
LLDPAIGSSIDAVTQKATDWARATYRPALARVGKLTADEREAIARDLSRFTGYPLAKINRKTLAFSQADFRRGLLGDGRTIDALDMRGTASTPDPAEKGFRTARYIRDVLHYRSELAYAGLEPGYTAVTATPYKTLESRWVYDTGEHSNTPASPLDDGLGPPSRGEPWMLRSVDMDPALKVFVGVGLFDSMNTCAGNEASLAMIGADRARHFTTRCYINGHRMAVDAANIARVAADVRSFIGATAPAGGAQANSVSAGPPGPTGGSVLACAQGVACNEAPGEH